MAKQYVIPGSGVFNDPETGHEIVIPGSGVINEQAAGGAPTATGKSNPLYGPLGGPLFGPIG